MGVLRSFDSVPRRTVLAKVIGFNKPFSVSFRPFFWINRHKFKLL